jgi:hypothetical protein
MGKKIDRSFKTYIWTQFPDSLERSKMLSQNEAMDAYDSDNELESEQSDTETGLEVLPSF